MLLSVFSLFLLHGVELERRNAILFGQNTKGNTSPVKIISNCPPYNVEMRH